MKGEKVEVPNHELLRCVGRGSYGEVWLARNQMGRFRAVKIIFKKLFSNPRPFEREFEGIKNFEPISRLHQGFLDILHVGMSPQGDYFFYIMELADDISSGAQINPDHYTPRTLADDTGKATTLPIDEVASLGASLARTLHFLHTRSLIHRDVKPSNIVYVDGTPKLADLGLVAEIGGNLSFVGTSGYIPPEGAIHPQSDIYSLGKVLYEIATGKDRKEFPVFPSDMSRVGELFLELNEVLTKACQADFKQRYPSAERMAADLEMLTAGRSLRRYHQMESRVRKLKQGFGVAAIASVVLAAVYLQIEAAQQRNAETRKQKIGDRIAHADNLASSGRFLASLPVNLEAWQLEESSARNQIIHQNRFASALAYSPVLLALDRYGDTEISRIQPSPFSGFYACSISNTVIHWRPDAQPDRLWPIPDPSFQNAWFSRDGSWVVTSHQSFENRINVRVHNLTSKQQLADFPLTSEATAAFFEPISGSLITGHEDGSIQFRDARSGRLSKTLSLHSSRVSHVELSPDLKTGVSAATDNTALIWDAASGQPRFAPLKHGDWVYRAVFHPRKPILATSSFDRRGRIWSTETGKQIVAPLELDAGLQDLAFSPDGEILAGCVLSRKIQLWETENFHPLSLNPQIPLHSPPESLRFVNQGTAIAVGCTDGSIYCWDLTLPNLPRPKPRPTKAIVQDAPNLSRSSQLTANAQPKSPFSSFDVSGFSITNRAARGAWIAGSSGTNFFLIKPSSTSTPLARLPIPGEAYDILISPDEKQVAVVVNGDSLRAGEVFLFNLHKPESPPLILKQRDGVLCVAFSPDGTRIATAGEDFEAHIWNRQTGTHLIGPLEHKTKVTALGFSSDGRILATGARNHLPRLWDSTDGIAITPEVAWDNLIPQSLRFNPTENALEVQTIDAALLDLPIPTEKRGLEELDRLSKLLSGSYDSPKAPQHPLDIYLKLKALHPDQFKLPSGSQLTWHLSRVVELTKTGNLEGAAFHQAAASALAPR